MGGTVFLPYWLFSLKCPSTGAYRLLGGSRPCWKNGGLWEGSCQWVLPRTTVSSVFMPAVSQSCPHVCQHQQETFQYQQVGLAKTPMRSLLFPLGPVIDLQPVCAPYVCHVSIQVTWDCVCTLQKWSFCFRSALDFLRSNPGLERQMLSWLLLLTPEPQAEESDTKFRIFTSVGEPLWYNYFPVCRSPTW